MLALEKRKEQLSQIRARSQEFSAGQPVLNISQLAQDANDSHLFDEQMKALDDSRIHDMSGSDQEEHDLPDTDVHIRELAQKYSDRLVKTQKAAAQNKDLLDLMQESTQRALIETAARVGLVPPSSPYRQLDGIQQKQHFSSSPMRAAPPKMEPPVEKSQGRKKGYTQVFDTSKDAGAASGAAVRGGERLSMTDLLGERQKPVVQLSAEELRRQKKQARKDEEEESRIRQEATVEASKKLSEVELKLKAAEADKAQAIQEVEKREKQAVQELETLRARSSEQISDLQARAAALYEEVRQREADVDKRDRVVAELEAKLKATGLERQNYERLLETKDAKIQVMEKQKEALQAQVELQQSLLKTFENLQKPAFVLYNIFSQKAIMDKIDSRTFKVLKAAKALVQGASSQAQMQAALQLSRLIANDFEKALVMGEGEIEELVKRYQEAK